MDGTPAGGAVRVSKETPSTENSGEPNKEKDRTDGIPATKRNACIRK